MRPESRLLAYFRGLERGRRGKKRRSSGGYSSPRAQIGYMVGFMRGRSDYRRTHPLGRT